MITQRLNMSARFPRFVALTVSASTTAYNVFTQLGSPTEAVYAYVMVNTGVVIGSTSTSTPAFDSGALPTGSKVFLTNDGDIQGRYGGGGTGAGSTQTTGGCLSGSYTGSNGSSAGKAINMQCDFSIDNDNGNIFAGGGGGGGGNGGRDNDDFTHWHAKGGNGGIGQGYGNASSPNAGAGGDTNTTATGGTGGTGGIWGAVGVNGGSNASPAQDSSCSSVPFDRTLGGAGGTSVDKNGFTLTWLAGNNASQVKGSET